MEVIVMAKNGMIAGRAPPEGKEKAGEISSLSSPSAWGANYRPAAHCTGERLGPATLHTRAGHSASPGNEGYTGDVGRALGERHFLFPRFRAHN